MSPSDTCDRSRSPKRSKKSSGGLKWKEKTRKQDADHEDRSSSTKTYRERSPKYDSKPRDRNRDEEDDREHRRHKDRRDRSRDRERHRRSDRPGSEQEFAAPQSALPAAAADDTGAATTAALDPTSVAAKFGAKAAARAAAEKKKKSAGDGNSDRNGSGSADNTAAQEEDTAIQTTAAPRYALGGTGEQMMIVHVNDRLGTKAAIPCMPSDPIKAFKAMVAARIGRRPHEIMIKRQGERPFKDQLTLEDYGVGNGVQLDLELDTGD